MTPRLRETIAVFLKLGVTAFGGPAAHIAMMEAEIVRRRKWVTHEQFLDLLGATNLIPGPNSTELAIHLGYVRAGWPGLIAAGVSFIVPAMLMVTALAWGYMRFGALPAAHGVLFGVKAVMIAIVADALWRLAEKAARGPLAYALMATVFALYLLGLDEIALLFGGAALFAMVRRATRKKPTASSSASPLVAPLLAQLTPLATAVPKGLAPLFLTFLKIGSVLYGSGYVLLAFLRTEFVTRLHWLTDREVLDAISAGQITPGPVFTTATFVGYLVGRTPGALVATAGIFLPSFVFVAALGPIVQRLRKWSWTADALDGVNLAAMGLMAGALWDLARAAMFRDARVDFVAVAIALVSAAIIRIRPTSTTWVIGAGAAIGLAVRGL